MLARQLRNNSTKSEIFLWRYLKGKQLQGYDFHRQKPLLNYIIDFYCWELQLAIELDGYSHYFEEIKRKDDKKEEDLNKFGIQILRFSDKEVFEDITSVIAKIEAYILNFEKHTPNPYIRQAQHKSQEGSITKQ